jgi:hypothetical protein
MLPLLFALLLSQPRVWRDEVGTFPRTGWLALTAKGLVRLDLIRFTPVDGDDDQLTVDAGAVKPIFLVRNLPGLEPGPVVQAKISGPKDPQPGDRLTIDLRGRRYTMTFDAEDKNGKNMRIRLSDGARTQLLWSQRGEGNDPHWNVLWAGDLDRDGQLDLLVDFSEHYAGYPDVLLLSSYSMPGKLVGEAARFEHAAC